MSIQAECREAMNRLAGQGKCFTEIDVANEASQDGWSGKHFEQAVKHAYNVLQGDYKRGRLCRFGPVEFKGVKDHARRGTKILYADSQRGPKVLNTPNGNFKRLLAVNDGMMAAGRKAGTNRDDTKPWESQDISVRKVKGPPVDSAPLMKRIRELEEELKSKEAVASLDNLPLDTLIEMLADHPKFREAIGLTLADALTAP